MKCVMRGETQRHVKGALGAALRSSRISACVLQVPLIKSYVSFVTVCSDKDENVREKRVSEMIFFFFS